MKTISGFTFIHDGITGGYPFVEAIRAVQPYVDEMVVVDMQSTDGTREMLKKLDVRILDGQWSNKAGKTLALVHSLNVHCNGDIIIHFEADEVYDDNLIRYVRDCIQTGETNLAVYRLQLECNFQRCRWWPESVHRVFPKGIPRKNGHTTDRHDEAIIVSPSLGFLWDCTNCFRDNWFDRIKAQAELWNEEPKYRMVPLHMQGITELTEEEAEYQLSLEHWTWTDSPFDLPGILKPLVGMLKYRAEV